jgi:dTDP-glucose 4,6-dehydratase
MNKYKLKCLVTGSLGFIFSNFIRKALYEKYPYNFITLDKAVLSSSLNNMYFNKALSSNYIADITDHHIIDRIFEIEKPDIVIHGAAETFVDYSLSDPNKFINTNVLGTQNLINSSLKYGVKKFIYISTDEVYGHLSKESDESWTEESPINPRNPYSASKAAGELLVIAANKSHGLIYNITRSSNNYGPRQTPEKLIPKVIKCIINKQPIPIYGQGMQIRDWTHVYDNCAGILTVLDNGSPNEIYNISANQEFTNIEVVHNICEAMGEGHELIKFVEDRPGHDFRYSINSNKIKSLGWKPQHKFKDAIHDVCDWYRSNQWFLR